ncbi:GntR family transcriptional regulator [Lacicoccus qingdaonensis]|uniref:GntR family transcriptional regulator n=1 Tax=Lacicoccus qingdaonensis TaxID=576118 RepID=A0A1G9DLI4_9BACL|nr:GntR family transcriptional regulator [Salinicoccus qingdaonensis]SDK64739.1 GntR family transcriptional regulator [Salinicoccus qingdaonensis]
MFDVDVRSRVPIYEQLVDNIKKMIIQNVLEKDEKLPSVRKMAQEITINPNTIQKAYRELESEGYIYSVPGKGSFVSDTKNTVSNQKIEVLTEELEGIVKELIYLGVPVKKIKTLVDEAEAEMREDGDR